MRFHVRAEFWQKRNVPNVSQLALMQKSWFKRAFKFIKMGGIMKTNKILCITILFIIVSFLIAGCEDDPIEEIDDTYTVTFNLNDDGVTGATGNPNPIQKLEAGVMILKPSPDPVSSSHNFDAWYKDAAGINEWDFRTNTVTSSITLFAKWLPKNPFQGEDFTYSWDSEKNKIIITGSNTAINYGQSVSISGPATADYTDHQWRINGVLDSSGNGNAIYTFSSIGRQNGTYNIELLLKYKGGWYSAEISIVITGGSL